MKGWHLKRIDQLGTVVTGKTPSSDNPDEFASFKYGYTESAVINDEFPKFLRATDINKQTYIN